MEGMAVRVLLLLAFAGVSAGAEEGAGASTDAEKKPVALEDVTAAQAFIDSAEISVIGFFTDLEVLEVKDFLSVFKDLPGWDFGLSTSPEVLTHFNINCSTVALFRQADDRQEFLEIRDSKEINPAKLSRFLQVNEIRLVTDYNPLTAIGIFNSSVPVHLLLFLDKSSQEQRDAMKPFREAAEQLKGKVLCVLVDITLKGNDRVRAFFRLTRAPLPAVAIYNALSEEREVLPAGKISGERLRDFSQGFLGGKRNKEDSNVDPDDKTPKSEL